MAIAERTPQSAPLEPPPLPAAPSTFAAGPVAAVVAAHLILHLVAIRGYGFFRDELYYLACAQRLDWGYPDHPPLCVWLLRVVTALFGESLWSVRLPSIFAGAITIVLVGRLTHELGGSVRAQTMAAAAVASSFVMMVLSHLYSMNSIDVMLWTSILLVARRILQGPSMSTWAWFGLLFGVALLNKLTGLWLAGGLLLSVAISSHRRVLTGSGPWLAAAIATSMTAPYLLWQIWHGWPTLEFMRNANGNKLQPITPVMFLLVQLVVMNPWTGALWVSGCVSGFRSPRHRWLAGVFLFVLALLLLNGRARENYLTPAYAAVLPLGAMAIDAWLERVPRAMRLALLGIAALVTIALTPLALPLMPVERVDALIRTLPVDVPRSEHSDAPPIQGFADMFGWETMHRRTREAWDRLSATERAGAVVLTHNYGEAAAIEAFDRRGDQALAGRVGSYHNGYWIWGPPKWDGQVAVLLGHMPKSTLDMFEQVEMVGVVGHPWAMPEERTAPVRIARRLKVSVETFWRANRRMN